MSTAKRMVVIPADQYETLKERNAVDTSVKMTSANEEKVLSLDDQMRNILRDNTLNDTDKLYKYSQVMTKYLDYKDKTSHESLDKSILRSASPGENGRVYTSEDINLNQGDDIVKGDKDKDKINDVQVDIAKDIGPDEIKIPKGDVEKNIKKRNPKPPNIRANVTLSDLIQKWIRI